MKYIEFRVYIEPSPQYEIGEVAEAVKDLIYDYEIVSDVTYEIKEEI